MNDRSHRYEKLATMRHTFHAATADELRKTTALRRLWAIVDQRVLFAHRGEIELSEGLLRLGSWKSLTPDDVLDVSMGYLPEYGRFAAGGARGGFPSFGVFKRLGAPLILDLRTGERIFVLIGFTWWSGTTKDTDWLPALKNFTVQHNS